MKKTAIIPSNGKIKIGTVLISLFDGKPYIITGGADASSAGLAHLASMLHGWNYTGKQTFVNDYHNITEDELNQMCGGNKQMFRFARANDVSIECIELIELQLREDKEKKTPADQFGNYSDKKDDIGIWTIFNITEKRFNEIHEMIKPMAKEMSEKYHHECFQSLANGGESIGGKLMPHQIAEHFKSYHPDEYAMAAFIIGQLFVIEMEKMKGFINSPLGKLARELGKIIH